MRLPRHGKSKVKCMQRRHRWGFCGIPGMSAGDGSGPRKPTYYEWGSQTNLDSYASFAIGFRTQEKAGATPTVREGLRMNDAKSDAAWRAGGSEYN